MEDDYWESFFNKAGIVGQTAKDYAGIFIKNKISNAILMCLNQSFLKTMGIIAVGDIIRIMKYIKEISHKEKSNSIQKIKEPVIATPPPKLVSIEVNGPKRKLSSPNGNIYGNELSYDPRRVMSPASEGRCILIRPIQPAHVEFQPKISNQPLASPSRVVIVSNNSQLENKPSASIVKLIDDSSVNFNKKSDKSWCVNVNIDEEDTEDETETSKLPVDPPCQKVETVINRPILQRLLNEKVSENSPLKNCLIQKLLPLSNNHPSSFSGEEGTVSNNINNNINRNRKEYTRTTKEMREAIIRTTAISMSSDQVAKIFNVSETTVNRVLLKYRRTGTCEAKVRSARKPKITNEAEEYIKYLIGLDCTVTLREIRENLKCNLGIQVSSKCVDTFLKKMKYTFKKVSKANGGMVIEGTDRLIYGYRVRKKH